MLAAALTGCTLGQEPQARSTPAPVLAPSAQAATGNIPEVVQKVEPSVVTVAHDQGTGSGVIWSKDGVVVTNNHVVRAGDQVVERVEVAFFDGCRVPGTVRATDPSTDLAVVQVDRKTSSRPPSSGRCRKSASWRWRSAAPSASRTPSPPASSPASTAKSPARPSRASGRWST
jgi:S1-C subfamily serine protease